MPPLNSNHFAIRHIRKSLRREWLLKLFVGVGMIGVGIFGIYFCFQKTVILTTGSLVLAILGIRFFYKTLSQNTPSNHQLIRLLLEDPQKIVWVYSLSTQSMPYGFHINRFGLMYFKLIDGDEISVSLPANKLQAISKSLNAYLPHATFGYTKEREQWYMAHPGMLWKDGNESLK